MVEVDDDYGDNVRGDGDVIAKHKWFYQPFHDAHIRLYDAPQPSTSSEFDTDADSNHHTEYYTQDLLEGSTSDVRFFSKLPKDNFY